MLSHVPGLQTYNSKQPFSQVNGIAVQIYRQASKLTTSPGSLRRHIKITCDYITLQIYMRPAHGIGGTSCKAGREDALYSLAAYPLDPYLCVRVEWGFSFPASRYSFGPLDVLGDDTIFPCFVSCRGVRGFLGSSQLS